MLPESVRAHVQAAFPGVSIHYLSPTEGGFSHYSAVVMVGAQRCVLKSATLAAKRADLRHEAAILQALAGRGLPVPPLVALLDTGEATVELLEALPGTSGITVYSRSPAELRAALAALANLLAATHSITSELDAPESGLAARAAQALTQLPALPLDDTVRNELAASLQHPVWQAAPGGLVHGDAGLHNLLWHPPHAALLDWEWASRGTPLFDLAWVWWTLRWRKMPPALWAALLARYRALRPGLPAADSAALRALTLGQIASILGRAVHEQTAYAEWQRRAQWTLGLEFPAL